MKYILTFALFEDELKVVTYHSVICEEDEVEFTKLQILEQYAPNVELYRVAPYEEPDDSDYEEDDEAIPF